MKERIKICEHCGSTMSKEGYVYICDYCGYKDEEIEWSEMYCELERM